VDGYADRLARREDLRHFGAPLSLPHDGDDAGWAVCRRQLRRAQRLLAERGLPFRVLLDPLLFRTGGAPVSHAADVDGLRVHPHDTHPGRDATRIAADAVADDLAREGQLPDGAAAVAGR
jgi:hypothetical protein